MCHRRPRGHASCLSSAFWNARSDLIYNPCKDIRFSMSYIRKRSISQGHICNLKKYKIKISQPEKSGLPWGSSKPWWSFRKDDIEHVGRTFSLSFWFRHGVSTEMKSMWLAVHPTPGLWRIWRDQPWADKKRFGLSFSSGLKWRYYTVMTLMIEEHLGP